MFRRREWEIVSIWRASGCVQKFVDIFERSKKYIIKYYYLIIIRIIILIENCACACERTEEKAFWWTNVRRVSLSMTSVTSSTWKLSPFV